MCIIPIDIVCIVNYDLCLILVEWWFYAMASSHRSSPVPQGSSSDVFFKKEVDPAKHIRPVQSLPDVCPKEPTGNFSDDLCYHSKYSHVSYT